MSKLSRAAQTVTLTAVACTAMTGTAAASASALAYAANVIFKEAVGYGVDAAIASALGSTSETVDLSEEAFDRIEEIVEDVVATYQFSDYQTNAEDALDAALAYTRRDSTTSLLESSADRAWDVYNLATSAVNDMETTGYQGASTFMVMSALQLAYLIELAETDDALGEDGDFYRRLATSKAEEHYEYMETLTDAWDEGLDDLFETRTKTVKSWYDGWYDKKKYKYCIDYGDEAICTSSTWTCKRPWYDSSAFAWSCNSRSSASAEINLHTMMAQQDATREVFGGPYAEMALMDYWVGMNMMLRDAGAEEFSR